MPPGKVSDIFTKISSLWSKVAVFEQKSKSRPTCLKVSLTRSDRSSFLCLNVERAASKLGPVGKET